MAPPSTGRRSGPNLSLLERTRVDPDNLDYGHRQRNRHTTTHSAASPAILIPEIAAEEAAAPAAAPPAAPPAAPAVAPAPPPNLSLLERTRVDPNNLEYGHRQRTRHTTVHSAASPVILIPEVEAEEAAEASLSDESGLGHLNASSLDSYQTPERVEILPPPAIEPPNAIIVVAALVRHLKVLVTNALAGVKSFEAQLMRKRSDWIRQLTLWNVYCALLTCFVPNFALAWFGMRGKAQQWAWREKIGLISVILLNCAFVGFLTFGFNNLICGNQPLQSRVNDVDRGSMVIHGVVYHMYTWHHPGAQGIASGAELMYTPYNYGGQDGSFLFQNVNGACKGLIEVAPNSSIPTNAEGDLAWYFPCHPFHQDGSSLPNSTNPYYPGYACHTTDVGRATFYQNLPSSGEVYFTWADIRNTSRHLTVYSGSVLDLDLLLWLDRSQVSLAPDFDWILSNPAVLGVDISRAFQQSHRDHFGHCLAEIIRVGAVQGESIGCITSQVVLYVSLVFILSTVMIKFFMALYFQWFSSRRYAASYDTKRSRNKTRAVPTTMASQSLLSRQVSRPLPPRPGKLDAAVSRYNSGHFHAGGRSKSFQLGSRDEHQASVGPIANKPRGFPLLHALAPRQPPPEWQPFGYPLAHALCLVTAYSEGEEGIRNTLNSIAMTEYPNSHKVILAVCDGMIRGAGEEHTTPDIILSMMKEPILPPEQVCAFSYVAVVGGSKRHNMAKVYAGYYDYGEASTIPKDEQQVVPMMVIVKVGTPDEAENRKPGNRGKRDSQVIVMAFLRRIMFNERITELEYEIFTGLRTITGVSPNFYEVLLMVDADTTVQPDSLTQMISVMVKDPRIMGLCGETRVANPWASWVAMIQVFEYFISHNLSKSFESVFGGVTCLPGCFAMYRIKAPKDHGSYWVPLLASPEVVDQYAEHIADTMHAKNLLLLGEDRFLSTVMLRTFPKRRQVFVIQARCFTMVPEQFSVLLSQRRRWINSTMHNLMELILVRDLCGSFCLSMRCLIMIELIGTTVLPAAISFTFYLIISSILIKPAIIPLILLALILGLPAVLIVLTAHNVSYIFWLVIYLLSLPIWNFVLPLNAYWKFDDFSWGETRKTAGDKGGHADVENDGEFDRSMIKMKRYGDFEKERIPQAASGWSHEATHVHSAQLPSMSTNQYQEPEMAFYV